MHRSWDSLKLKFSNLPEKVVDDIIAKIYSNVSNQFDNLEIKSQPSFENPSVKRIRVFKCEFNFIEVRSITLYLEKTSAGEIKITASYIR